MSDDATGSDAPADGVTTDDVSANGASADGVSTDGASADEASENEGAEVAGTAETTDPFGEAVPASAPAEARSSGRTHLLSLAPWALLSVGWGLLTAYKLTNLVTPGALAGLLTSLGLVVGGVVAVVRYGDESAGKFLAGCLFLIGGVSTVLSASAGSAVWFPNDLVTTIADVTILGALVLVLSLKTERGRDAVA